MANAWMIRNDGKAIPVTVHLYGALDDPEETLYAAEWLYHNTKEPATKAAIHKLVVVYAHELDPGAAPQEYESMLLYQMKHLPYKVMTPEFIKELNLGNDGASYDLQSINTLVNDMLNQEFLRARYGGMYDSDNTDGGEMYFRISSTGYNWFPVIWEFVYNNRSRISTVTVVKDPESTGMKGMYLQHNGEKIDRMPVDEFINLSGRPVMDSYKGVLTLFPNMNMLRRHEKIMKSHAKDSAFVKGKEFNR